MTYRLRYTAEARADLKRLYAFLLDRDVGAAERALAKITKSINALRDFPSRPERRRVAIRPCANWSFLSVRADMLRLFA